MTDLISIIFNMFDYASPLLFCLVLWRFRLKNKNNVKKIIYISIILSFLSYLCNLYTQEMSVLISICAFYICFKLFFKTKALYTLLIVGSGYAASVLLQIAIVSLLLTTNAVESNQIQPFTTIGYSIQFSSFILALIISLFIKSLGWGFAFEPEETFTTKQIRFTNRILMMVSGLVLVIVNIAFVMIHKFAVTNLLVFIVVLSAFTIVIYLDNKRDDEEFT